MRRRRQQGCNHHHGTTLTPPRRSPTTTALRQFSAAFVLLLLLLLSGGCQSAFLNTAIPERPTTKISRTSCFVDQRRRLTPRNQQQEQRLLGAAPQSAASTGDDHDGADSSSSQRITRDSVPAAAEFDYQELRANLDAVKRAKIAPRDLDPLKRLELEDYARKIVRARNDRIANPNWRATVASRLPGTTWRLAFSTQSATMGDLPRDASVLLKFLDAKTMEYSLEFEKTWGLKGLTATSSWSADENGIVTFVYDKISANAFGMSNLGVGMFGMLQGRANYVETAYFDGKLWIEVGSGVTNKEDDDFINVYVLERDEDAW